MSVQINFRPSEALQHVYQPADAVYTQSLDAKDKRYDTLAPTNQTTRENSYIYQQPMEYMPLRIKSKEVYQVTVTDTTVPPSAGTVGTSPALLNSWNFFIDNFANSKALNGIRIKWGGNTLESTQDDRNPFLIEMKSAQFDLQACERWGLSPLAFSGQHNLTNVMSQGPLDQNAILLNPTIVIDILKQQLGATVSEGAKKLMALGNNVRVRIQGSDMTKYPDDIAPKFTNIATTPIVLVPSITNGLYPGEWVPYTTGTSNLFWGNIVGVYYIEVTEFLIDDFLFTPYQKNKTHESIQVQPASFVTFNLQYNTDYITNGLFTRIYQGAIASTAVVVRQPGSATITVESFDVSAPPVDGYSMKILTFRPKRLEIQSQSIAIAGTVGSIATFNVYDQSDTVNPPYIAIACDPELFRANQVLATASNGPQQSLSKFQPAKITNVVIQINQETITDNIPIEELFKMSCELQKNPALADWTSSLGQYLSYSNSGVGATTEIKRNRGFCFLLLDVGKLALLNSKDCSQLLPNVNYGTPQVLNIKFTVVGPVNDEGFDKARIYYPHVYKFFPYYYEQTASVMMTAPKRIEMSYGDAANVLMNGNSWRNEMDLTMIGSGEAMLYGSGWFDSTKAFFSKHGSRLAKAVMAAVRSGEENTRDNDELHAVNKALKFVSDSAASVGYGPSKRGSAIRNVR